MVRLYCQVRTVKRGGKTRTDRQLMSNGGMDFFRQRVNHEHAVCWMIRYSSPLADFELLIFEIRLVEKAGRNNVSIPTSPKDYFSIPRAFVATTGLWIECRNRNPASAFQDVLHNGVRVSSVLARSYIAQRCGVVRVRCTKDAMKVEVKVPCSFSQRQLERLPAVQTSHKNVQPGPHNC